MSRFDDSLVHVAQSAGQGVLLVAVLFLVATTSADVDLWGHVRFGLDMLETGRIDSADPYAFTSDRYWINHEWLSELLFAVAWQAGNAAGLIALKVLVVAGTMGVVWRTLHERGVFGPGRVLLGGLAFAGILPRIVHIRPQLFSVLLFAVLAWVLTGAESGRRRRLAMCVPLFVLWANLHGGWIVGLATLGLWAAGDVMARRPVRDALLFTAAAAFATLLNPYGTRLWSFILQTVRPPRARIGEWSALWNEPVAFIVWLLLAALTIASVRERRSVRPASLLVAALWGISSLQVARLDAFFALSVTGLLAPAINRVLGRSRETRTPHSGARLTCAIAAGVATLSLAFPSARSALTCIAVYPGGWPEPESVAFIRENALSGRVLTHFNWGEYAIWHVPRSLKVSIDGRRETVYSDTVLAGHFALYDGRESALEFVDSLGPDYAWLPSASPGVQLLERAGWLRLFAGERSTVLGAPARGTNLTQVVGRVPLSRRCFPGP